MKFESINVGATVTTNVLGGVLKQCVVLDKKPAGDVANWTQSQGAVIKLRVLGSKGRLYIVRTAAQLIETFDAHYQGMAK